MLNTLKFVQPSFNYELFEKDRQRINEQIKAKELIKQQDKERRKAILERMAKRNQELYPDDGNMKRGDSKQSEDLDYLDNEEELAMLGKRYRDAVAPVEGPKRESDKKQYGVMRPPVSRDDDTDEKLEADDDDDLNSTPNKPEQRNTENPLNLLSQKMLNKQKTSGY